MFFLAWCSTFIVLAKHVIPYLALRMIAGTPWLGEEVEKPLWIMFLILFALIINLIYGYFIYKTSSGKWMRAQGAEMLDKLGIDFSGRNKLN